MVLVIGLGNPGAKYAGTRHNVGFEAVDLLADRHGFSAPRTLFKAETRRGFISGTDVLLLKPMTFMNLSGDAVGQALRYFKAEASEMIVIHDELDFEPGKVRVKKGGGHGGHNGLRSIIQHSSNEFARIRLGIGKPQNAGRGADHVLSLFDKRSRLLIDEALVRSADAVEAIFKEGLSRAMNEFNRREEALLEIK